MFQEKSGKFIMKTLTASHTIHPIQRALQAPLKSWNEHLYLWNKLWCVLTHIKSFIRQQSSIINSSLIAKFRDNFIIPLRKSCWSCAQQKLDLYFVMDLWIKYKFLWKPFHVSKHNLLRYFIYFMIFSLWTCTWYLDKIWKVSN